MPNTTPPQFTDRHESFCRHMARGASGAAAARWAGFSPTGAAKQASEMLTRPHIRRRIEDLRVKREAARQAGIAEMVDRLRALAKLATAKGDYRTAVRCIEIEARACGLFPDRHAANLSGGFAGADPLLDGIDPRHPAHAAAEAEAWLDEWRAGLEPEAAEEPEPRIVPHVYDGFEGRPVDDFTPETDLARMAAPPRNGPPRNGRKRKDIPSDPHAFRSAGVPPAPFDTADATEATAGEDARAPDDPIASRAARAEAQHEADLAWLRSIAPPVAINPAAPAWARHPDPLIRGAQAELSGGWDPAWNRPA